MGLLLSITEMINRCTKTSNMGDLASPVLILKEWEIFNGKIIYVRIILHLYSRMQRQELMGCVLEEHVFSIREREFPESGRRLSVNKVVK